MHVRLYFHVPLPERHFVLKSVRKHSRDFEEREQKDDLVRRLPLRIYPSWRLGSLFFRRLRIEWFAEKYFSLLMWNFNFGLEAECPQTANVRRLLRTMSPKRNCFLQKFYYEELPVAVLGVFAGEPTAFTDTVAARWLSPVPRAYCSLPLDRVIYCKFIQVVPGSRPTLSSKNSK